MSLKHLKHIFILTASFFFWQGRSSLISSNFLLTGTTACHLLQHCLTLFIVLCHYGKCRLVAGTCTPISIPYLINVKPPPALILYLSDPGSVLKPNCLVGRSISNYRNCLENNPATTTALRVDAPALLLLRLPLILAPLLLQLQLLQNARNFVSLW